MTYVVPVYFIFMNLFFPLFSFPFSPLIFLSSWISYFLSNLSKFIHSLFSFLHHSVHFQTFLYIYICIYQAAPSFTFSTAVHPLLNIKPFSVPSLFFCSILPYTLSHSYVSVYLLHVIFFFFTSSFR